MPRFQDDITRVKDHLRAAILRAELPEGTPVQEEMLRSETGASVRAVKQALRDLSAEGLLRRKRHAGTRVSEKLPSIICAVLPPVRSIGIVTAVGEKYAKTDAYFQAVLKGIQAALQPPAKLVEVFQAPEASVGLDDMPRVDVEAAKRSVQGFISIELTDLRGLNDLVRLGLPIVAVDFVAPEAQFDSVSIDHMQSGFLATKHLMDLGHRRIAYVGEAMSDHSTDPAWQDRLAGYLQAMAIRTGPTPPLWILDVRRQVSNVPKLLADFHRTHLPTAYVLGSGGFAGATVHLLRELGLECPRDYSLVSADHSEKTVEKLRLAEAFCNFEELGRSAVRLLATRLACRPMPVVRSMQHSALVLGETVAPPPAQAL